MVSSIEVPSKCCFEMIPMTLEMIERGKDTRQIAKKFEQHPRHGHFLLQNVRILGLVEKGENGWVLTDKGKQYLASNIPERRGILQGQIEKSKIIQSLIMHYGSLEKLIQLSNEDISDFLVETAFVSKSRRKTMQRVTADRRASSVRAWISWHLKNKSWGQSTLEQDN